MNWVWIYTVSRQQTPCLTATATCCISPPAVCIPVSMDRRQHECFQFYPLYILWCLSSDSHNEPWLNLASEQGHGEHDRCWLWKSEAPRPIRTHFDTAVLYTWHWLVQLKHENCYICSTTRQIAPNSADLNVKFREKNLPTPHTREGLKPVPRVCQSSSMLCWCI